MRSQSLKRKLVATGLAMGLVAACCTAAAAFPDQPVRLIVGNATGGIADTMARIIQPPLQELLGQPVIVVNRPGALGALAAAEVARAKPDGYSIVLTTNSTVSALPLMQKNVGFTADQSFAPVGVIALSTMVMVSHPGLPAKDLRVPYKGVSEAANSLIAGDVKFMINSTWPSLNDYVRQGKLNLIGVTGSATELVPGGVPARQTVPDVSMDIWYGLLAPAGTPADVVETLNRALAKVLAQPAVRERFFSAGAVAAPSTAKELSERIVAEKSVWKPAVDAADLRIE